MAADLGGYKLALVASFKINILLNFKLKNETSRANLNTNKRIFKWRPFWNKVYALRRFFLSNSDIPGETRVLHTGAEPIRFLV